MPGTHVIRRQFLDVEFHGAESRGYALQTQLLDVCEHSLSVALEALFDRLVPTDEHWTIDRLVVDAGQLKQDQLERALVMAVSDVVERQLREHTAAAARPSDWEGSARSGSPTFAAPKALRRSGARALQDAFIHFLESGVLPWWMALPANRSLEDAIFEEWSSASGEETGAEEFVAAVRDRAVRERARRRLVRQFTPKFLATFLEALSPGTAHTLHEVLERLASLGVTRQASPEFVFRVSESALIMATSTRSLSPSSLISETLESMPPREPTLEPLLEKLQQCWPEMAVRVLPARDAQVLANDSTPAVARELEGEATAQVDLDEGEFVRCAGVVLAHPFLPRLFAGLGIAENDTLVQPERALSLLHFLATGQLGAPEYDLLLPKLLCGMPPEELVSSHIAPTAQEQEEVEALLAAVIQHWDALGDLSLDGLRGSYLVRPGKLSLREDDYLLQVEPRGYDILMDQLPWGIGLVRLPWMRQTLWVEWRM